MFTESWPLKKRILAEARPGLPAFQGWGRDIAG